MTNKSSGVKYLPALGALLLLLLVGTAAMVLTGSGSGDGSAGFTKLVAARSAITQVRQAAAGNEEAFDGLSEAAARLQSMPNEGLTGDQVAALRGLTASIDTVVNSREAFTTLSRARGSLETLLAELDDRSNVLEEAIVVQRQPIVAAQLARMRLLGEALLRDVRALGRDAAQPALLTQQLLDSEMALSQVVRGFQAGDPELGLRAVSEPGATDALATLAMTADSVSQNVRDVLAVSDQLTAVNQSLSQINQFDAQLAPSSRMLSGSTRATSAPLLVLALLAAATLVLLLMAWIHYRSTDMRRDAEIQAKQTERNQAAIMRLLDELGSLADGDLTVKATVTEDITGAIADSINYAIEALRELVVTLNDSAIMVDSAAKQTDQTAQQLAKASESQSNQVDAASQAIMSMAASIEGVSGDAERSSDVARHSVDVAHKGGDAVRRTIEGMNTIRETIQETSKRIKRLGESSQEIGNIVELINDIADQTNILALNASIQASMAGEAGRGFAVVADEVQRLAERSTNATKQIEVLVRTIQADTNEAVVSMERSTTDVVGGALLAENAGAALEEIEQVSNQIASLVQNISISAREQGDAAAAVNQNMDALQAINKETANSTSATTESIRKLAELAGQLRQSVAGFRLPDAEPSGASGVSAAGESPSADNQDDEEIHQYADQQTA